MIGAKNFSLNFTITIKDKNPKKDFDEYIELIYVTLFKT